MLANAQQVVDRAWWGGLKPDPLLTVSEWADEHRYLSQKASAESGKWRTSRTPYLREIMDCLSPSSPIEDVIFMKGAQVGGSECGNNFLGYVIAHAPGPMLMVLPDLGLAKDYSRQRIQTLIEESPAIRSKVAENRSRDGENSILSKSFQGGMLKIAGANSAASLSSMPCRYVFMDEVDRYPLDVDGEGDPVTLAEKRTSTFQRRKKYKVSTPTIEGRSRIASAYQQSDRRRYFVPCPHCDHLQWLKWSQLKYEQVDKGEVPEPVNVRYICESCQGEIREHHKTQMLKEKGYGGKAEWRAENPGAGGGKVAGFHLSSLYSPVGWKSWHELVAEWLLAQGDPPKLKGFINTSLGETWKDKGDAPEWERLYDRRELYEIGTVPDPVVFLTAAADVQKNRIEVEVCGWCRDKQSYSIEYIVIMGDTSTDAPWAELDAVLGRTWRKKSGLEYPIRRMAVDTGYNAQTVYNWVRRYPLNRVMAVKGRAQAAMLLGAPTLVDVTNRGRKVPKGVQLWTVGVDVAKTELYGWLKLKRPTDEELENGAPYPAGYCHFPQYEAEFFKQLTAEQLVVRIGKGNNSKKHVRREEWEKTRDRNEALDCRIYNRAAAHAVGMDRFNESQWLALAGAVGMPVQTPAARSQAKASTEASAPSDRPKRKLVRRKSTFL